jgi:hypothetical protein
VTDHHARVIAAPPAERPGRAREPGQLPNRAVGKAAERAFATVAAARDVYDALRLQSADDIIATGR